MEDTNRNSVTISWILASIIFLTTIIVKFNVLNIPEEQACVLGKRSFTTDCFYYSKMKLLLFISVILLIYFTYLVVNNKLKLIKNRTYIFMITYSFMILLSAVISRNRYTSFFGMVNRYEGAITLLGYVMLMFIAMNICKNDKAIKIIVLALLFTATCVGIIGLFQYLNLDFFNTKLGKLLIVSNNDKEFRNQLKFSFDKGSIYSTLGNPNYVGSYTSVLIPFISTFMIYTKNKLHKILFLCLDILMIINLIGSNSRGGMVSIICSSILIILIAIKNKKFSRRKFIIIIFLLIFSANVVNKIVDNRIIENIASISKEIVNMLSTTNENCGTSVKGIDLINKDKIVFNENDKKMYLRFINNKYVLMNDENNILRLEEDKNTGFFKVLDENFKNYMLKLGNWNGNDAIQIKEKALDVMFVRKDGELQYLNLINGETYKVMDVEKLGFEGKESLGSNRGYIWSRTIPLLKKTLICGYGPDNFGIYFPKNDYIGIANSYQRRIIIDKPHSQYLNIAVNTGIISLIIYLIMYIYYIVNSMKIYSKIEVNDFKTILGLAIFISIFGYLIVNIFNDSALGVAPSVWILTGVGIGINYNVKFIKKSINKG